MLLWPSGSDLFSFHLLRLLCGNECDVMNNLFNCIRKNRPIYSRVAIFVAFFSAITIIIDLIVVNVVRLSRGVFTCFCKNIHRYRVSNVKLTISANSPCRRPRHSAIIAAAAPLETKCHFSDLRSIWFAYDLAPFVVVLLCSCTNHPNEMINDKGNRY